MRRMIIVVTLVVGVFVGGTMSVSAAEPTDVAAHVGSVPGHASMSDQGGPAKGDGICTAYFAILERANR